MKNLILTLMMLIGFVGISMAEKAPIKFGQVTKEELLNNTYTGDTSAAAVILCDYAYYTEVLFKTVRVLRIKILKKEGYEWANQSFETDSKTDIRGITFNLEDGAIVETKLKNTSIYKTRITENWYEMRVAMPNVKVGSIIDVQFSFNGIPREWNFQQEIPVVHSELIMEPSNYVKYQKNYFGYFPLSVSTSNRWVAKNVPAFKPEPYITSSNNFRTRFEFDIESVSFPNYYQSFTTSWDAVRDLLYENTYFGIALNADGYLRPVAKSMAESCSSTDEKIRVAYDYVKQIKWDKSKRFTTENTYIESAYNKGKGNSAEINLALVQLLRKLNLQADPVVLSTRENGVLSPFRPSINKLNYVIAAVITEKDTLLLDATEEKAPPYLLPLRVLNGQGQLMNKNKTGWIELKPKFKSKEMTVYTLDLADDMSLKGKITCSMADYAAFDFRNNYRNFNSDDEYLKDYKEDRNGLKIRSHTIENLDSLNNSIKEEFEVVINNFVNEIDGDFYITPLLYDRLTENPFKVTDRTYPVDFGYAREKTVIVNITLPPGYTVVNLPSDIIAKLPGNTAAFSVKIKADNTKIMLNYRFSINKTMFVQTEYADFRELYNQIISKSSEPVVLKKM